MNTVDIRCNKNEYYQSPYRGEREVWLEDNVGDPYLGRDMAKFGFNSTWGSDVVYEGSDVIITYTFKYSKDAIMFKSTWS